MKMMNKKRMILLIMEMKYLFKIEIFKQFKKNLLKIQINAINLLNSVLIIRKWI